MLGNILRFAVCLGCLAACSPIQFALAPGAQNVRVTKLASDVAGCTPVGNLQVPKDVNGLVAIHYASGQLRNQAIGFGGNVAFVTEGTQGIPVAGIAYRCPR